MAGGILGIGINSLMAYKTAIATTSQNISNATTPFFSRRRVEFVEGLFNTGVQVSDVQRVFDEVANKDYMNSTSIAGRYSTFYNSVSDFETVLDDSSTNIAKYLNDSLAAAEKLTATVKDIGSRTAMLTKLSDLAHRMNAMSADVANRKETLNSNMNSSVNQVNDILDQIGTLNAQLAYVSNDESADLLDQRNALVHSLAGFMNITTLNEDNNGLSITLSNGISIVSGSSVNHFKTIQDSEDSSLLKLGLSNGQGIYSDITSFVTEGSFAGMISLRQDSYDVADRGLGRIALVISALFNDQNKLGADLNGNLGGNIFNDMNTASLTAGRITEDSNNVGSGTLSASISDVTQLQVSDYEVRFTSATAYTIIRTSDGSSAASGTISSYPASASFDGVTLDITAGTFSAGDKFMVHPYAGAGASLNVTLKDPRQLAMAYPISVQKTIGNIGDGSIQVTGITDTTTSDFTTAAKQLSPPIKIVFLTDTSYQIVNATTSGVIEGPITYDPVAGADVFPTPGNYDPGYRVRLSEVIKAGDSFNITYNTDPAGGNDNAIAMTKLYTAQVLDGGTTTMNSAYNAVASQVSLATSTSNSQQNAANALMTQSMKRFYAVTGVDSMEEMTNLMNYQQSYQASAQIIQVAKSIFDTVFNMVR